MFFMIFVYESRLVLPDVSIHCKNIEQSDTYKTTYLPQTQNQVSNRLGMSFNNCNTSRSHLTHDSYRFKKSLRILQRFPTVEKQRNSFVGNHDQPIKHFCLSYNLKVKTTSDKMLSYSRFDV